MNFADLIGTTLSSIVRTEDDSDTLVMTAEDGRIFRMMHHQDCCEHVYIESIVGDIADLIGSPILHAEEATKDVPAEDGDEMWTFYKLATAKGYVDIRWNGSSNGYYSVSVTFEEITHE